MEVHQRKMGSAKRRADFKNTACQCHADSNGNLLGNGGNRSRLTGLFIRDFGKSQRIDTSENKERAKPLPAEINDNPIRCGRREQAVDGNETGRDQGSSHQSASKPHTDKDTLCTEFHADSTNRRNESHHSD